MVGMSGGLAKLIYDELEAGIDVYSYDAVVVGRPRTRRDRTASAAPLGWVPPADAPEEGTSPT
jgi:hypothetical protein